MKLDLELLPDRFAVYRLDNNSEIPPQIFNETFFSITKTSEELSIICREQFIINNGKVEKGWRAVKVIGPLDFALTGILSSIITPLSDSAIGIFTFSTFDTDYILIKEENCNASMDILRKYHNVTKV